MQRGASVAIRRRIQWADTDASGWYHNTVILRLIEEAENELLDGLGIMGEIMGRIPRVRIEVDYRRFLRFWDEVEVRLEVQEVGRSSTTYRFEVNHEDQIAAEGRFVTVLVDAEGKAQAWPKERRKLLLESGPQG